MTEAVDYELSWRRPRREGEDWKVAGPGDGGRPCRGATPYRCPEPVVMALNRRQWRNSVLRPAWWFYCRLHNYGRVVRDGEVWWDPAAAEELLRDPAAGRT